MPCGGHISRMRQWSFASVRVCPLSGRCGHEFLRQGRDGPVPDSCTVAKRVIRSVHRHGPAAGAAQRGRAPWRRQHPDRARRQGRARRPHVAHGGIRVQLRDKQGATRAMTREARAIHENLMPMRVQFLMALLSGRILAGAIPRAAPSPCVPRRSSVRPTGNQMGCRHRIGQPARLPGRSRFFQDKGI
jgi:hypothetical protein